MCLHKSEIYIRWNITIKLIYLQNADENEVREGDEPKEMSKATKSLRQKAKVLGRFKGLGKLASENTSEVGSEEGTKSTKYHIVWVDPFLNS